MASSRVERLLSSNLRISYLFLNARMTHICNNPAFSGVMRLVNCPFTTRRLAARDRAIDVVLARCSFLGVALGSTKVSSRESLINLEDTGPVMLLFDGRA